MRSIEEQITEINRRREHYTNKKQCRGLSVAATVLSLLLISLMIYAPRVSGQIDMKYSSLLGATILGPETGGYVIVALLAFALGVIVTLLIQKRRIINDNSGEK